jgi:opacity protein-like surface antigen
MMMKTLLAISCVVSFSGVCFADSAPAHDDATEDLAPPQDGWRSDVSLGASRFPSASIDVGTGVSVGVLVGKEWMSDRMGVQLGLELEAQSFGHILTSDGDLNTYAARPTVRFSYYANHWMPYGEVGLGYMYASESDTVGGMSVSSTDNMLALEAAVGLSYRIGDRFALGAYVRYEPCFEPALNQFVDIGAAFTVLH